MRTTEQHVATYIRAKDENRPYLLMAAFAPDITLQMVVKAGSISFPPFSRGVESIADVLVRRFAQTYENVHTFCLTAPPVNEEVAFSCDWLVGMSEKQTRIVLVGCGRYDWLFQSHGLRLVERLTITIELMQSLAPDTLLPVMRWLSSLPRTWCSADVALTSAPALDELKSVRHYVGRDLSRRVPSEGSTQ